MTVDIDLCNVKECDKLIADCLYPDSKDPNFFDDKCTEGGVMS